MYKTAISVYEYDEIIRRMIDMMKPLEELTGYPYKIEMYADNCSEPPRFIVSIFEWHKDHHDPVVCYCIDQNTTLDEFDNALSELQRVSRLCAMANRNGTSYAVEREKECARLSEKFEGLPF